MSASTSSSTIDAQLTLTSTALALAFIATAAAAGGSMSFAVTRAAPARTFSSGQELHDRGQHEVAFRYHDGTCRFDRPGDGPDVWSVACAAGEVIGRWGGSHAASTSLPFIVAASQAEVSRPAPTDSSSPPTGRKPAAEVLDILRGAR
jgi:hypothetical protein